MIRKSTPVRMVPSYKQRSSVYHAASLRDAQVIINEIKHMNGALPSFLDTDGTHLVLPPKQPTPDVILRSDIMPKQRTRTVL